MSSDKPAQSSLDSDDDLLKEDDENICLYAEEGEEIDRRDEDRLLASDEEGEVHHIPKGQAHHVPESQADHGDYIEEPTIELMAGDELGEESFDPIPPEDSYHHHIDGAAESGLSHYTTNTHEGEFLEDTEQATDNDQYSTVESVEPEDESESEDEEDKTRGRFKSERSNIVTITSSRSRTNIPDTLEITREEEEKISQFMDPKKGGGKSNNRNHQNQRQGQQRYQHRPRFPNQQNPRRPFIHQNQGVPLMNQPGHQQQFWGQGRGNNRPHQMRPTNFPNSMNQSQQPHFQGNSKSARFTGQGPRFRNNFPPTIFDTPNSSLMQPNHMQLQVQTSLPTGLLGTPLNQMLVARQNRLPPPPNLLAQGPMHQQIRQQSHPQMQYESQGHMQGNIQGHVQGNIRDHLRGPSPHHPQGNSQGQLLGHPRGPPSGNVQGHPLQGNAQGLPHGPQGNSFRQPHMPTQGTSQGPQVYAHGPQGNPQGLPRGPPQGNSQGYPQGQPQGNLHPPQGNTQNLRHDHPQTSRSQGHRVLINPHFRAQTGPEQRPPPPRAAWPQKEQDFGGNAGNIRNNNPNFNNQQPQFQNRPQWSNPEQHPPDPVRHSGGPPTSQPSPFQQRAYGGQPRLPNGPESIRQQPAGQFPRRNSDGMDYNSRLNEEQDHFSDEMDGQLQHRPAGIPVRGRGPPRGGQQHHRGGQIRPVAPHQHPVRAQQSLMGEHPGAPQARISGNRPQRGGGHVNHPITPMQVTMVEHSGQPIQTVVGNKRPVSGVPTQPGSSHGDNQSQFSDSSRQPAVSPLVAGQPNKPPPKPKPPTREEVEQQQKLMKRAARFASSAEAQASATISNNKPAQAPIKAAIKRLSVEENDTIPLKVLKTVKSSAKAEAVPGSFDNQDYDLELEEKLEQQRLLREKILKQKEKRRLEVAQRRRSQLEKKLSPPGSSSINNTQGNAPVVPTTPTGIAASQQPVNQQSTSVTQTQPPAPKNIAQSSAPLKKNIPARSHLVDDFVWRSVLVKTKNGQVVRRKEKIPVSTICPSGGRGRGRGRGTPAPSQMETDNSPQVRNAVSQGTQMLGVRSVEPVRTINTVGGLRAVGKVPAKRIVKGAMKQKMVTRAQLAGSEQELSRTAPVVSISPPVGRTVQSPSRSVIANEIKPRRVVLSADDAPSSSIVLIRGTSSSTTEHSIRNLTDKIGPIQTCVVDPVQRTAKVYFHSPEHALAFRTKFNRYMLDLAMITVLLVDS